MAVRRKGGPRYLNMSPDEVLDAYPRKFFDCRDHHDWSRRPMWRVLSAGVRERIELCRNCGSMRVRLLDRDFRPMERAKIRYARGYLTVKSGLHRWDFVAKGYALDFERAAEQQRILSGERDASFPEE